MDLKEKKLRLGAAYHGNRILRHVDEDMRDIVAHNMNTVVHMFTHNDWDRHLAVMKDIISLSESYGLEVWIDNWGLSGSPGDKSFFLELHPEAHQILSDGKPHPTQVCYNSPAFIQFTKDWLDTVRSCGGKKVFWDEPCMIGNGNDGTPFSCFCPECQKLFLEKYGKPMPLNPEKATPELKAFRRWTIDNYFDTVSTYAASLEMENSCCAMPHTLDEVEGLMALKHMDDFGTDPYWGPRSHIADNRHPYPVIFQKAEAAFHKARDEFGKKTHLWIQAYDIPAGHEDDIILASDAAYDMGARTILYWSYRGGESNTYRADRCEMLWHTVGEATARLRNRHFDMLREEARQMMLNAKK